MLTLSQLSEGVQRLVRAVCETPGRVGVDGLRAVVERGRALTRGEPPPASTRGAALVAYLDDVIGRSHRITDEQVTALAGDHDDDEVLECTLAAAVGAGVARIERVLELLEGID